MKNKAEKVISHFYQAGNWGLKIIGGSIFLLLTWYSLRYTYYMVPGGDEIPVNMKDSVQGNLLALAVAFVFLVLLIALESRMNRKAQIILRRVTLVIAMLWVGVASFWWIFSADRVPEGDQAFIYGGASYFIEGNYEYLSSPGAYAGLYPHQLGLIALVELLFRVVGTFNYYVFEYLCALMSVGIVYLGYRLLSELTDCTATIVTYNILMLGCLPLIFYTPWVYGDIPSIFFALLAGYMLLLYTRKEKTRYLFLTGLAVLSAVLVRKHSLILVMAFGITAVFYALKWKNWRIMVAFLMTVALTYGAYQGIYKMYEIRSGYEHSRGIPITAWFAMGLQESQGRCGWYNNYPKQISWELDYDYDLVAQEAKREIQSKVMVFQEEPEYARMFFRDKILSQWNQPLYQSLFFNTKYTENLEPEEGSLAARLGGDLYFVVLMISDRLQFIVFFGMMCYFFFAVEKNHNILRHVLATMIIGGFLFSIIHEAMSRYVFPYYVMMFPFAVYGCEQAVMKTVYAFQRAYQRVQYKMPQKDYVQQETVKMNAYTASEDDGSLTNL